MDTASTPCCSNEERGRAMTTVALRVRPVPLCEEEEVAYSDSLSPRTSI